MQEFEMEAVFKEKERAGRARAKSDERAGKVFSLGKSEGSKLSGKKRVLGEELVRNGCG